MADSTRANMLPYIQIHRLHSIPFGAMKPGDKFDPKVLSDPSLIMQLVWFTTPKKIHGIWHHDTGTQLLFAGYECQECHEIFLVPNKVGDGESLHLALRHECCDRQVG